MAESWTILYNEALQSQPRQLGANIHFAREAICSRLDALIGAGSADADLCEWRALVVALRDLHVLSVSVRFCCDLQVQYLCHDWDSSHARRGPREGERIMGRGGGSFSDLSIADSFQVAVALARIAAHKAEISAQAEDAAAMREHARRMRERCAAGLKKCRVRVEKRYPGSCPEVPCDNFTSKSASPREFPPLALVI